MGIEIRVFGRVVGDGGAHGGDGLVVHLRGERCRVGGGEVVEHERGGVGDREEVGGFLVGVSWLGWEGGHKQQHTSNSTQGNNSSPTPIRSNVLIPLGTIAAAMYTSATTPPRCPRATRSALLSPCTDAPPYTPPNECISKTTSLPAFTRGRSISSRMKAASAARSVLPCGRVEEGGERQREGKPRVERAVRRVS